MSDKNLVKELVDSGIHYGHRTTHWNPKMAPYIFGKRNKIHIIDVKETIKGILLAQKFLKQIVSSGKDVLIVGTKRQARDVVTKFGVDHEMPYVAERWLGGCLTNFETIRQRVKRLEELEGIIESGEINSYSKKMEAQLRREHGKIYRNLNGIRKVNDVSKIAALIIIDVNYEHNAVKEARKLGIPTICLIDTNSDPDLADIAIPGNDDAIRAIETVLNSLGSSIEEGKNNRAVKKTEQKEGSSESSEGDKPKPRARSSRAQYSSETPAGN